ncbi:MAG: M15 family metallopeptidase [Candidatus Omnitrophica bacterium]|nr:M15 family metallopeptidase [Candidatus Omnitrophota bacterium]
MSVHTARPSGSLLAAVGLLFLWVTAAAAVPSLNVERLSPEDVTRLQTILQRLEPLIASHKQLGTANLLTWDELYQPLAEEERAWLDAFRALKGTDLGATSHYFGELTEPDVVPVGPTTLDAQFLPRDVADAYEAMMQAMERDLGKHLLVESGYRSPAYQLYLFLFYMPKHDYSIRETNRFVALPGHSEHGYPPRQAIDFINQEGINGEDKPEEFEALPEYQWLQQHANEFGFFLSYPRDNPHHTAFEPWHWHYEPTRPAN